MSRLFESLTIALFRRIRVGIALQLCFAFVAVALFVLAANFVVIKSISIERTTTITRTEPPALVIEPVIASSTKTLAPVPEPATKTPVPDLFLSKLSETTHAVELRTERQSAAADGEYSRALTNFDHGYTTFLAEAVAAYGKPSMSRVDSAMTGYRQHARQMVHLADERRAIRIAYSAAFEELNKEVKHSLDGAWTLFGRVVTRQALLQLNTELDTLRQSARPLTNEQADADSIAVDVANEEKFQKTLEGSEKALRHAGGDAWYQAVHADLEKLSALRISLQDTATALTRESTAFSDAAAKIVRSIPKPSEHRAVAIAPTATVVPPVAAAIPSAQAPAQHTEPRVQTESSVNQTATDGPQRRLFAWVSGGVLALLLAVCVGATLSIVRPVRQLLRATTRIAKGDLTVRVPRGGIKELDTLAQAFNAMATEVAGAKAVGDNYQQELEQRVAERTQQLQDLADHDPLTGLPNRRQLFKLLNQTIVRAQATNTLVGVFFLDVDNFKTINESQGHAYGDRLLIAVAERLDMQTREYGFAARLGGDEFTVVFAGAEPDAIRAAGLGLVQAFQSPLSVDGRDLKISVSVGASLYPLHGEDPESLLPAADAALFRAKKLGKSQLAVFTPNLLAAADSNFKIEQGLRRALERGEFELHFQPEVSAETLETVLVEALIRWRRPDGKLIGPGEFLGVAEESGLIIEISDWVLQSAIETAARWHHGAWPQARVAINVSPRQLLDAAFVDRLAGLLQAHRLPPRCIEIELTESILQTGAATVETLQRLRGLGIAIALDDFGTGYSSFASLEQLPLTRIKLDRSLVCAIDTNSRSAVITRGIISLCQGLGLEITAEGVERSEHFSFLVEYRSMFLQGYLLSRPVPGDEIVPLMPALAARARELLLTGRESQPALAAPATAPLGLDRSQSAA